MTYSEIRESTKVRLLDKVRRQDYGKYLSKLSINRIRGFSGEDITFEFPVTALIGPNGSGKSSVLGAAGCAYKEIKPSLFSLKVLLVMNPCLDGRSSMSLLTRLLIAVS